MTRTFPLGQVHVTPNAHAALGRNRQNLGEFLTRHARGDWGEDANDDDRRANELALEHGGSVLSAYRLHDGEILWVNTDGLRFTTLVWLPSEEEEK